MRFILRDLEKILCAVLFAGMTLLGFANVVVRYASNQSLAATEELLTNGFLLLTLFGAAVAARRGDHLAVTLVHDLLPPRGRRVLLVVSGVVSLGLIALSGWYCWQMLGTQWRSGSRTYGLGLPAWYYSAGLPLGFAFILIRQAQNIRDEWRDG